MSLLPNDFYWKTWYLGDDRSDDCVPNPDIWPLCWLTQFSLLGGELWFAVLSANVHVALTNPFVPTAVTAVNATIFVYAFSILVATILVVIVPIKYGLSSDPMIWILDANSSFAATKFYFFYMFMILIYIYAAVVSIWARNQVSKGLEESLATRKLTVSKQTRCQEFRLHPFFL
jgi:hypothetical protein